MTIATADGQSLSGAYQKETTRDDHHGAPAGAADDAEAASSEAPAQSAAASRRVADICNNGRAAGDGKRVAQLMTLAGHASPGDRV